MMRIAFLHNWSWLGASLAKALLEPRRDELWLVGAHAPVAERDPELIELSRRSGALQVAPKDVGSPAFLSRLRRFAPELIVVGTFPMKIPASVLRVPSVAAINVHTSLLPAYRGALPEFWVIRNGEEETGVSIHLMTDRFDAGHVLARARVPVHPDDTLLTLSKRINRAAPPLLLELLDRYRAGRIPLGEAQDDAFATRAPAVREEHLEIRWGDSASSIERLVRASFPVFEAHTTWRGERIVIRGVHHAPSGEGSNLGPGVLRVDADRKTLLVGTGDGILAIRELEHGECSAASGFGFALAAGVSSGEVFG